MLHSHFDRRYYDGESILSARYIVPAQKTRGLRWWQQTVFTGPRDPVDRLAVTASSVASAPMRSGNTIRLSLFKFDWQIVAITATRRVTAIYSDDADVTKAVARTGIRTIQLDDLAFPAPTKQAKLDLSG